MKLLLATDVNQYIWIGVLLVLLVGFFVYSYFKNKRNQEKYQEMTNNLEKGDKVLTSAGIIGKIVSVEVKEGMKSITIETGDSKHKGYITVDSQAIYVVLDKANKPKEENLQKVEEIETKVEEKVEDTATEIEEIKVEEKETKTTKQQPKKKSTKKK